MKRKGIVITLTLIAIVAIAGGITLSGMKKNTVVPVTTVMTPIPTPTQSMRDVGSSDTDLDKDAQNIDAKLKALDADTSVSDSLNDQQGNLSEQ